MKTKSFLLLVVCLPLAVAAPSLAQNISGTNLRASNSVAVGTTADTIPLYVIKEGMVLSGDTRYVARFEDPSGARGVTLGYNVPNNTGVITSLGANSTLGFWTATNVWAERMRITPDGKVGIGLTVPDAKLHVAGDIKADGVIHAKFQDIAEWVPATEAIAPGTVVVIAERNHVSPSSEAYDTRVAGVVSPQPGLVLGESGASKVLVATTGRVRVRVDATRGAIREGDLLVTSPTRGVAMKSEPMVVNGRSFHQPGTLIGKALEPLAGGVGEILVLLSMQ